MAKLFISRLLETFFRRKWLYLLPLVPFLALGVFNVVGQQTRYRSVAVRQINDDTLLSQLNATADASRFGGDTAATAVSELINETLRTKNFLDLVVDNAGMRDSVEIGALTLAEVGDSVWASADGTRLVAINAATRDPELSLRLANATVDSWVDWQVENETAQSKQAIEELQKSLTTQQTAAANAVGAARTSADAALAETKAKLQTATERGAQARSEVLQKFRAVDPPTAGALESNRKEAVITLMMYLVLGGLVSAAALVVATLLDRSMRYAEEIEVRLDVPVVATIPDSASAFTPRVL